MADLNSFFKSMLQGVAKAFNAKVEPQPDGTVKVTKIEGVDVDRHLVLVPLETTCTARACPNYGKTTKCLHVMAFSSLHAAETYRSKAKQLRGGDPRIISGAKLCARYRELLHKFVADGCGDELVDFVHQLYAEAKSPQLN